MGRSIDDVLTVLILNYWHDITIFNFNLLSPKHRLRAVPIFPLEFVELRKRIANAGARKMGRGKTLVFLVFNLLFFLDPFSARRRSRCPSSRGKIGTAQSLPQTHHMYPPKADASFPLRRGPATKEMRRLLLEATPYDVLLNSPKLSL